MTEPIILSQENFKQGLGILAEQDSDLRQILRDFGPPPMWTREPGFPTLIHIILEQQVSLASAKAAYERLLAAASPLTPVRFLELGDTELRKIGFSRQKTAYGRHLAQAILEDRLDLKALAMMDDATVRSELIKIKGIGPWTADIYLLMALRRPDIWPSQDIALAVAAQKVKRLAYRPKPEQLELLATAWQPWRAIAARLLWHYYLSDRAKVNSEEF